MKPARSHGLQPSEGVPGAVGRPADPTAESRTVKVWDPLVRLFHWSLVAGVALAWITSDAGRALHEPIGYAVIALVAVRGVWGAVGGRYARFAQFVRGPAVALDYTQRTLRGSAPRYIGHNPLGGWMVLALLITVAAVAATGWMMTLDAWFGDEWLEELHEALATGLLGLVALHVVGAVVTGVKHGENLVRAMVTGVKRAPVAGDVD